MFNWGLHDGPLGNVTQPGQAGLPAVYAAQLDNITAQLKAAQPQAKLLYAGTTAYICSAGQDGCVVNLNNQAAAIMKQHQIPMLNLHDAITAECGPAPNASCFGEPHCFCPHCSPGGECCGCKAIPNAIEVDSDYCLLLLAAEHLPQAASAMSSWLSTQSCPR